MGKAISHIVAALFYVAVAAAGSSCRAQQQFALEQIAAVQDERPNQIITHTGYTVGYNSSLRIPNWVAYELTAQETQGQVPRKGNDFFQPDPEAQGASATYYDYSRSNYDRGHMAPAGDMKWSVQAMKESFYLSNICPQNKNLNNGDWKTLEERVRSLAKRYGSVYVVCGPIVSDSLQTIGENKVAVPDAFFKVLLVQTRKGVETVGFVYRNQDGHQPLRAYMTTVDEVEELSGIDFFSALSDEIESAAESVYHEEVW